MIRWLSAVFLKWSIKLNRYAEKVDGKIDNGFAKFDKEVERIKKQIKKEMLTMLIKIYIAMV